MSPVEESPLVAHAFRELELLGQTREDPEFAASLVAAVEAFASYGHSGSSAAIGVEMLARLLRFEHLSPITSDPDEWLDVSEVSGWEMWQSKRNPSLFSKNGGKTHYHVDEPEKIIESSS